MNTKTNVKEPAQFKEKLTDLMGSIYELLELSKERNLKPVSDDGCTNYMEQNGKTCVQVAGQFNRPSEYLESLLDMIRVNFEQLPFSYFLNGNMGFLLDAIPDKPFQLGYVSMTSALTDTKTHKVYQQVQAVNARGQATQVRYGNGVMENRSFASQTGWLSSLSVSGSSAIHTMAYAYDAVRNVTTRQINFGAVGSAAGFSEAFGYDNLHRVTTRTISNVNNSTGYAALPSALRMNEAYGYDHFGNITSKTGVGHYCYDASKTNRLTGVWSGANCTGTQRYTMAYDANGNVTNDGKRTFTYTAFDKNFGVSSKLWGQFLLFAFFVWCTRV